MKKDTVVCIIGIPQAGKTTFSRFLAQYANRVRGSCSEIIYPILADITPELPITEDWHTIDISQRDSIREKLVTLGNAISDQLPAVFPIALVNRSCRVIDGVRRKEELHQFREYCAATGKILKVLWVERVNHPNPDITDNTELEIWDADIVISAETIEQLECCAENLVRVNDLFSDAATEQDFSTRFDEFEKQFDDVSRAVHETAIVKGWWETQRNDAELICLMHSELSEAVEALRHGNPPDDKIPEFSGVEAELADTIIRIMDMARARGWRVAQAITAKMKYNTTRAYKHGGKKF